MLSCISLKCPTFTEPLHDKQAETLQMFCSCFLQICLRTLQHEEPDHPVQVDVLMLPLQEGCSPGEAAQDVIDHLRP